jgi:hypothetical protein
MKAAELREEIAIEFEALDRTLAETEALPRDIAGREPATRELAAAGLFLANLYNGIENILKRIRLFHGLPLPSGPNWHIELFKSFCDPPEGGLPLLLDPPLEGALAPFRRLRHVVHHGYGFRLQWDHVQPGIERAGHALRAFRSAVQEHLASLGG